MAEAHPRPRKEKGKALQVKSFVPWSIYLWVSQWQVLMDQREGEQSWSIYPTSEASSLQGYSRLAKSFNPRSQLFSEDRSPHTLIALFLVVSIHLV
jgi:hypothetical protein